MVEGNENTRPVADLPPLPPGLASKINAAAPEPALKTAPAAVPVEDVSAVNYGLIDSLRESQSNINRAMGDFVKKMGDFLSQALDDAASLEVKTYVTEDMGAVQYENKDFTGSARLRALTRVNIDGDTLNCVPEVDGELDVTVWNIHMEMVKQAQASRAEFIKTVVQAATGIANLITPKP
ncbi:MAG: hypothetical protein C0393_00950 [Anaerolinea sp.]|nr:hypothetical protein [Anaerolinea sp.]